MLRRATLVSDIFMIIVAFVVAVFGIEFAMLIGNAVSAANGAGLTGMFTSYGYVTIEATFLCMMLVGAYQVFRVGLRRRVSDEDWDFIESDG